MKQRKERKVLTIPIFIAIYASVVVVCVVLDQLTKHFVEIAVRNHGRIPIIGDWLTLTWTTNNGATGGLFKGLGWQNWLFFIITLVGLPVFCWLLLRSRTRSVWGQVAFAFIIGGTIGNAIDRMFLAENGFFTGEVRDFVHVKGFFGIFNVADSFLVVGVILAILAVVFFDHDSLVKSLIQERNEKLAKANATANAESTDGEQIDETTSPTEQGENLTPTEQTDGVENADEKD